MVKKDTGTPLKVGQMYSLIREKVGGVEKYWAHYRMIWSLKKTVSEADAEGSYIVDVITLL